MENEEYDSGPDFIDASDDQSRTKRSLKKRKKKKREREESSKVEPTYETFEFVPVKDEAPSGKKRKIYKEVATLTKVWSQKEARVESRKLGEDFIDEAMTIKTSLPVFSTTNECTLDMVYGPKFAACRNVDPRVKRFVECCHKFQNIELTELNILYDLHQTPTKENLERLKTRFPMFKSGRFSPEEDSEIKKHFGMLIFDLKYDKEEIEQLLEIVAHSRHAIPARLYIGAIVGQRVMLERRLAIDVFNRLLGLIRASRRVKVLGNEEFIEELVRENVTSQRPVGEILTELSLKLQVSRKSINNFILKAKRQSEEHEYSKGKFSLDDSEDLLREFLTLYSFEDIDDLNERYIDWKMLGKLIKRNSRSTRLHFMNVVLPALRHDNADRGVVTDWGIQLFKALLDDQSIKCRQDINWKKLSSELDLPITRLENIYQNNIRGALAESSGPGNFRSALLTACTRLEGLQDKRVSRRTEKSSFSTLCRRLRSMYLRHQEC